MDRYVTGSVIRTLREERGMTQEMLAAALHVSGKTVSKWETGQGLPDISLLEPLAKALGISVVELFSGETVKNGNRAANMLRARFYVCPVCGNIVWSCGETVVCCCGITLPPLVQEEPDEAHAIRIEPVEDELYLTLDHPMTKEHFISFFAVVTDQGVQIIKQYPEGNAEARCKRGRVRRIYAYCNHHGLFCIRP